MRAPVPMLRALLSASLALAAACDGAEPRARPSAPAQEAAAAVAPQDGVPSADDSRRLGLATRAMEERRYEDVGPLLAELLARGAPPAEAQFIAGSAAYELRRYAESAKRLAEAVARRPALLPFASGLGFAQLKLGDFEAARRSFEAIVAADPSVYKAQYGLGLVALTQGRVEEARAPLERALALRPDYLKARFAMGRLLHEEGRLEEARAELESVLASWPSHDEALFRLGQVLAALGLREEAEAVMARRAEVYALNEEVAGLHGRIGAGDDGAPLRKRLVILLLDLGDVEGAAEALRDGRRRFPGDTGLAELARAVDAAR